MGRRQRLSDRLRVGVRTVQSGCCEDRHPGICHVAILSSSMPKYHRWPSSVRRSAGVETSRKTPRCASTGRNKRARQLACKHGNLAKELSPCADSAVTDSLYPLFLVQAYGATCISRRSFCTTPILSCAPRAPSLEAVSGHSQASFARSVYGGPEKSELEPCRASVVPKCGSRGEPCRASVVQPAGSRVEACNALLLPPLASTFEGTYRSVFSDLRIV